jgi:nucleosome assembly protein 1-like 1
VTVPTESFFNFFSPPQPPTDDDDTIATDIEERLELDYQLGEDIKEKLIPRAIDWFTGEALQFEELGDDMDADEFDDEDDEDDEEDEDDDDDRRSDRDVDEESEEEVRISLFISPNLPTFLLHRPSTMTATRPLNVNLSFSPI